ncbi:MAG: tryptophan synthase subunit alpha [Acidimicrobiia bacterium]
MGAERLRQLFVTARSEGRTAFLPFMTAGLPTPAESPTLFAAMAEAGADAFEVGIPYSDPLMDGPIIQRGSDTALAAGSTLDRSLEVLAEVASTTGKPVLAMTYANPVFRRGVDGFCARLAAAGSDGIIVPDLPVEESLSLRQAAERHGIGTVLFVAPTSSPDRIRAVADANPVFIYAVAEMGVTGERTESSGNAAAVVQRIRAVTDIPIVFGVGISTPEQAAAAGAAGADGVIVGSALVRLVLESATPEAAATALAERVSAIRDALGRGTLSGV